MTKLWTDNRNLMVVVTFAHGAHTSAHYRSGGISDPHSFQEVTQLILTAWCAELGLSTASSHASCSGCWATEARSSRSSCWVDRSHHPAHCPSSSCNQGRDPCMGGSQAPWQGLQSQGLGQPLGRRLRRGTACGGHERDSPNPRP